MKRLTLQDMQQWAINRNGKCLSKEYWDRETELTWRCEKAHVFDIQPIFVQRGAWCPQCTIHDRKLAALELMQEWAQQRGGKCLSKKYVNNQTQLEWECKNGHKFKKTRDVVKQKKNWCHQCNKIELKKRILKKIQNIALKRNGKCLSHTYFNSYTKLKFQCQQKHKWKATPHIIIYSNAWCPYCYGNDRKTIHHMHKLAATKNGKCLSKKYINSYTLLKWQCNKKHTWTARPSYIKEGTWCPQCRKKQ